MKAPVKLAYGSLAALLAHYQALRAHETALTPEETARLAALSALLSPLEPSELGALNSDRAGPVGRLRERVERRLRRKLIAQGILRE